MKKPKIYIAGPMRGLPAYNVGHFNIVAKRLRAKGWDVANPAEIGAEYGTPEQIDADPALLAAVMAADLHALETCDALLLLEGWTTSRGARKELAVALAADMRIFCHSRDNTPRPEQMDENWPESTDGEP